MHSVLVFDHPGLDIEQYLLCALHYFDVVHAIACAADWLIVLIKLHWGATNISHVLL